MLAGLSKTGILSTPPGFWANAVPLTDAAISNALAAIARSFRAISIASLEFTGCAEVFAGAVYLSSQTSSKREPL